MATSPIIMLLRFTHLPIHFLMYRKLCIQQSIRCRLALSGNQSRRDMSVGLQGSCILFLDPDRFDLTVGGRRRLF
jgi:hypothetical protein